MPTFGNKIKPSQTKCDDQARPIKWDAHSLWEDIENAFVTIENRLDCIHLCVHFVLAAMTRTRLNTWKEENYLDALIFFVRFCCWIWFGAQGLKTLFFFSKLILLARSRVCVHGECNRLSLPLFTKWAYSYKNANLHSCLIWIRFLFVRGLAIVVVSSCKNRSKSRNDERSRDTPEWRERE